MALAELDSGFRPAYKYLLARLIQRRLRRTIRKKLIDPALIRISKTLCRRTDRAARRAEKTRDREASIWPPGPSRRATSPLPGIGLRCLIHDADLEEGLPERRVDASDRDCDCLCMSQAQERSEADAKRKSAAVFACRSHRIGVQARLFRFISEGSSGQLAPSDLICKTGSNCLLSKTRVANSEQVFRTMQLMQLPLNQRVNHRA